MAEQNKKNQKSQNQRPKQREKKNQKKKKKSTFRKVLRIQLWILFFAMLAVVVLVGVRVGPAVLQLQKDAKEKVEASDYSTFKAAETSLVYDINGDLIKAIKGEKDVYYLDFADIPDAAVKAMISIEDKKFYDHKGFDIKANIRAVLALIKNKGGITQGASTITQQLSRNVFLTMNVSWERKIEEIFVAMELEKKYSKNDILEFYLNNVYFSNGYYGIQAASNGYFNKSANSLSLSQIAFLCAIPNSPTLYDPRVNPDKTLLRRDRILKHMLDDGVITDEDYNKALKEKIKVKKKKTTRNNYVETYIYDSATKALMEQSGFKLQYYFETDAEKEKYNSEYNELYAKCQKSLYTGGYRIYTSIDLVKQDLLQDTLDEALANFTETTEDGIFKLQGAATCIDNETGKVVAIVGGRKQDNKGYTLNRAFQSFRQPGSTIKPLVVYTPQFERKYNPSSIVDDTKFPAGEGPKNSNGRYEGKIPLRQAVQESKNVVAWKLFQELTPAVGMEYIKQMNFSRLEKQDFQNLAAGIGGFTNGASTVEMASGFATLENDGVFREPTCIIKIMNTDGQVLVEESEEATVIYSRNAARTMTDVLKDVFSGTGRGLAIPNMDSAGKTGTTNDNKDGWFCGYTPYYTTTVWVGCDQPQPVPGLYGSTYPGRIWNTYMTLIHQGLEKKTFMPYESREEQSIKTTQDTTETTETTEDTTEELTEEVTTEKVTTQEEPTIEEVPTQAPEPSTEAPTTTEAPPTTEAPTTAHPPDTTEAPQAPDEGDEE